MADNGIYTVSTVRRRKRRTLSTPIKSPRDVYGLIKPLVGEEPREHFYALYLNIRNRLLAIELVSVGTVNASIVHPREVFKKGVELSAHAVIIAHNHPSGEPDPSEEDLNITTRLKEAGQILGIVLLDHIIVCNGSWTSFKEEGYL